MNEFYDYEFINEYNSHFNPSAVHARDAYLVKYFTRYNFNKVISCYSIEGMPEEWAENYFYYVLFGLGYISILNTDKFGVVPQLATLGGYDLYKQPQYAIISNPVLKRTYYPDIGSECEIVKIFPDYRGIMDVVTTYADLMALCLESAGINLLNSKYAWVFMAENQAQAESFKKMYDKIASGEPAVFADKNLFNEDGSPNWLNFMQNVSQNYITDKVLNDLATLENEFNTKIGIPNANTQKKERLITDEVNANNAEVSAIPEIILKNANNGFKKVKKMFGIDMMMSYKWASKEPEVSTNVK